MYFKSTLRSSLKLVAGFLVIMALSFFVSPGQASAATKSNEPVKDSKTTTTKEAYNYVAQPGDSYTKMSRKAVQTFGKTEKVKLSHAQIIFVETNMTKKAGWPLLGLGQKVSIDKSEVSDWVKEAQKLTDSQVKAWQYYVQFVDFNTNNVGEVVKK